MELGLAIIFFIIGVYLVIKGGDWFVASASWIAHVIKIPTFIIGATIVSFATTLPELTISVIASFKGQNDMAVGNALGSVIANTGLIMAIAFTFMNIKTPRKKYFLQCLLLISSLVILWLGCFNNILSIWTSLILFIVYIMFIVINIIQGQHKHLEKLSTNENPNKLTIKRKDIIIKIFLFILSAIFIIGGSNLLINNGTTIAEKMGIPEHIIAISIIAIGTSLPELITTIAAIRKKEGSLSIGNIIGSNIINLCLILSTCSLVTLKSFIISTRTVFIDFPFCFVITLIGIIPLIWKQRSYKWQGILMVLIYIIYLITSVLI